MADINTVLYGGKDELTMAQYEALETVAENTDFDLTDYPHDGITNIQMTFALTCQRLFPAGTTMTCIDDGTYSKGHIYQIQVDNAGVKSWSDITIDKSPLIIPNTSVTSWTADTTYSDFGYKSEISITGLSANDVCEIIFNQADASSGNYAQVNSTSAGILTIYSKVDTSITIPTIIVFKGGD